MNEYEKQAELFAKQNGIKLTVHKQKENLFNCTLSRNGKNYYFELTGNTPPSMRIALIQLEMYDLGSYEYFCSENGYNPKYPATYQKYLAAQKGYNSVKLLFNDIIEELRNVD